MINLYMPEKILITNDAKNYAYTKKIIDKFPEIEKEYGDFNDLLNKYKDISISKGKKYLLLTLQKGNYVVDCPGTPNHICCGYKIIDFAFNCHFNCSYCFLQFYQNMPFMVFYVNVEKLQEELKLLAEDKRIYRIGTGEFADSLGLDNIFNFSEFIIDEARKYPDFIFELKTKSVNIENLLKIKDVPRNVVISWSMNPEKIAQNEELGAATITKRLDAAEKVEAFGYKLAFHFDPIIVYPGFVADYKETIDSIFAKVQDSNKIAWISLGGFRYDKKLKQIIEERFPNSKIIYGETVLGNDQKIRYLSKLRKDFFSEFYNYIYSFNKNLRVYLCMETEYQWKFLNKDIQESEDLIEFLDKTLNFWREWYGD